MEINSTLSIREFVPKGWKIGAISILSALAAVSVVYAQQGGHSRPGGSAQYVCPDAIQISENAIKNYPGWTTRLAEQQHGMKALRVYDGPPSSMVLLKPDRQVKVADGKMRSVWDVPPNRSYWMECEYSDTLIRLQRQLEAGVKSCWFETNPAVMTDRGPMVTRAACE